jgi:hypothetical protein
MKEALSSSETSVLIRATRRNIQEDTILRYTYSRNSKLNYINDTLLIRSGRFFTRKLYDRVHSEIRFVHLYRVHCLSFCAEWDCTYMEWAKFENCASLRKLTPVSRIAIERVTIKQICWNGYMNDSHETDGHKAKYVNKLAEGAWGDILWVGLHGM